MLSFTEEMQSRGTRPRFKVLAFETCPADEEVAEALHLAPGDAIFLLRRVRMANSLAMVIECAHLPCRLFPDLKQKYDPRISLYSALSKHYGIVIAITDEVAEAGVAKAEETRLLRIPKGSPVFQFTRTSYAQSDKPVEYVRSVYRADRYKIVNRLTRSKVVPSEEKV